MKKSALVFMLLLIALTVIAPSASAAQSQWSFNWQYSGYIHEEISIQGASPEQIKNVDGILQGSGWKLSSSGENAIYTRSRNTWREYQNSEGSLPIEIKRIDYIVYSMVSIKPAIYAAAKNPALNGLEAIGPVSISITMPENLSGQSLQLVNGKTVVFDSRSFRDPVFSSNVIIDCNWFQWYEMGIVILILVTLGVIIYLSIRTRRINKFIEEEYSLQKVEEMILELESATEAEQKEE